MTAFQQGSVTSFYTHNQQNYFVYMGNKIRNIYGGQQEIYMREHISRHYIVNEETSVLFILWCLWWYLYLILLSLPTCYGEKIK